MGSIVRTVRLSHKYATSWAIRDININIQGNGVYGLLGSNGAGKSTTMNIICGALRQSEGEVYIDEVNLQKHPLEAKRFIGFLPQTAPLYLDLTVVEYLEFSARLRGMGSNITAAIKDVMGKCDITHVKDRLLKNLSGGYRQRVGLAQAIIHRPKLVILDEPTNGLDPIQITEVRSLIKDIAQEHTVLLSSHILSEIQALCQQIIMIEQGKLVFSDTMSAFNSYIVPQSMLLVFENAPEIEVLERLTGVRRADQLNPGSFRLFYDADRTVGENIIIESVKNGWRLAELTIERNSVDEIFRQLTKKAK